MWTTRSLLMHALAKKGNLTGRKSSRYTHGPSPYARPIAIRKAHRQPQVSTPVPKGLSTEDERFSIDDERFSIDEERSSIGEEHPSRTLDFLASLTRISSSAICRRWTLW